jgi:hypothetical protein
MDPDRQQCSEAGFRIRIRIRIKIADPDPGGEK